MAGSGENKGIFGIGPLESSLALDMVCDLKDSENPAGYIHELIGEHVDPRGKIDAFDGAAAIALGAVVTATDYQGTAVEVVRRYITKDSLVQLRAKIVHALYGPNSELMEIRIKDGELDEWREECRVILEKWPHS